VRARVAAEATGGGSSGRWPSGCWFGVELVNGSAESPKLGHNKPSSAHKSSIA
jgi:hypothetical protein